MRSKHNHLALAIALAALAGAHATAMAAPAPRHSPAPVDIPFQELTLANGLRVIVHTDHSSPVVAVNVWYHVGAKNEPLGRSGFAHLFEHLMFQRSENHKGEYFDPFEKAGATHQNGTTNGDRTNYFENVPTTAVDMALWMESDRMGHLVGAIDQAALDEQRGVVQNEKRQGENQPYGLVWKHLVASSYPEGHPYHHTTIGSMNDLNAATLDDVKHWFQSWYGPNNAVLVLAGDIDVATAKAKVTRYFGDIAPSATVPAMKAQIAARTTSTRETLTDRVPQARLYRVWNVPAFGTADADRLKLFAHILGGPRSSRLVRRLTHDQKLVDTVSAEAWRNELGSIFIIEADIKQGVDPAAVERAIDEELKRLIADGPTAEELARARTVVTADFVRGLEHLGGFGGKADILASCAVFTGKASCFRDSLTVTAKATSSDVAASAKTWLSQGDHVLLVTPGDRAAESEPPAVTPAPTAIAPIDRRLKTIASDVDRTRGVPDVASFPALVFPRLQHATLSNGLQVVVAERHTMPLVELGLEVRGAGLASDPANARGTASFAMGMLDEGSGDLDALALGERIDALGASLDVGATLDTATVRLSAMKENLAPSLSLLANVLLHPRLDAAELERVRAESLAAIRQEKSQPRDLISRVAPALVFGAAHPYGAPASGTEGAIQALTRDDLAAWIRTKLRPDAATLIVVGDTTLAEIQPKLEAALGAWKAPADAATVTAIPTAALPARPRVFLVDQPGAIQATLLAAQAVPSSRDGGALDLDIANDVLGGQFSSRLNMNLREDKHWSYGSYARIADSLGPRTWNAYAAVQIDKTIDSLREMQQEIVRYADGKAPATAAEVAKIQATAVRRLPGSFETSSDVLEAVADIVRYGRPDDWPSQRATRIQSMTPDSVNAAIRALKSSALTWIIVGDLKTIEPGVRALKLGEVKVLDRDGKVVR